YFYFAVPIDMVNPAKAVLDELYPYAGLLTVRKEKSYPTYVGVARDAKRLAGEKLTTMYLARMAR
ncbi:unnamed protein product, partial [marine sediment metagenome]